MTCTNSQKKSETKEIKQNSSKIYLGIDPGSYHLGWAILKKDKEQTALIDHGVLEIPKEGIGDRLQFVYSNLYGILQNKIGLDKIGLDIDIEVVMEDYFVKSYKGAKVISQVQGIILLLMAEMDVKVSYMTPTRVKKMVCENGKATKEEVKRKVKETFDIKEDLSDDESDAIAVVLAYILGEQNESK